MQKTKKGVGGEQGELPPQAPNDKKSLQEGCDWNWILGRTGWPCRRFSVDLSLLMANTGLPGRQGQRKELIMHSTEAVA